LNEITITYPLKILKIVVMFIIVIFWVTYNRTKNYE